MLISLVTRGSPHEVSGGHLFHQRMVEAAAARGAVVEVVSAAVWRNPFRQARGLVLVDSLTAWTVAPWVLARRHRRRPLAAILHQVPGGVGHGRIRTALQGRLDLALYRRCDVLIVASTALGDEMVRLGCPPDQVRVVEPGSDVDAGRGAAGDEGTTRGTDSDAGDVEAVRHGRRLALLCVANWLPGKGVLDLLEALAALPAGDATLHLAGRDDVDPAYTARVRTRLDASDLADRVIEHGVVGRRQLGRLYACADAFVLPSYAEAYGTVYGEALRAGLPTVGWRCGNLPNLVDDGVEGCLVAPGDIAALSAALHRLATDEAWRHDLGAAAARRGRALPTWHDTADAFFGALSPLATRRG